MRKRGPNPIAPARAGRTRSLIGAAAVLVGTSAIVISANPSCTQKTKTNAPPNSSTQIEKTKSIGEKSSNSVPVARKKTYADAIRRRQFEEAASLIDASTEADRKTPEVRYARALVALEQSDPETALRSVNKLEKEWPEFEQEVQEVRKRAATQSRDVTLLSHFLENSQQPEELLALAEAHLKSSSTNEAKKITASVLEKLSRSKRSDRLNLEAKAHTLKARTLLLEDKKRDAAREYRWLATSAASLEESAGLDSKMTELDPALKLSSQERLNRAKEFSEKGWVKRTEQEIALLKQDEKSPPPPSKTDPILAWAIYTSRTNYEKAAELFARSASHGGKDRQKNLYYEAKALARSHRDRDAIKKYEAVAKMGGEYTDHATYQAARLRFIDGRWKEAVQGYRRYLKNFGKSAKHRAGALYDLPIARLAAQQYRKASDELEGLLEKEKSERKQTRLKHLLGVALLGAGKKEKAEALFREVIVDRPLSFSALVSSSRLVSLKKSRPALISPAQAISNEKKRVPLALSLPNKVWRLSRVGLDQEAEAALKREETRLRKQFGKRGGEALCHLYGKLQSAQRRFQVAQWAATWSHLKTAPNELTSWEWDCIYPTPYNEVIGHHATLRQVPTSFVYAVMRQESAFRPAVVSPANAVGLMQIIPRTAGRIAEEINATYEPHLMRSPAINIQFGTYYLRRLLDMFGNRPELAAAAYNAGPQAVTRWLRAGENLPMDLFVARIPYTETRNYVYRVMGNYARYAFRNDEESAPQVDLTIPGGLRATDDAY